MQPDAKFDVLVVGGFMLMLGAAGYALVTQNIPKDNMQLFTALAISVSGFLGVYVGYRWGASKGSAQKDQVIADMATKSQP